MEKRYVIIAAIAVIAIQISVLYWLGHPIICRCEYLKIWDGAIKGPENSQHLLDWYFFSHVIYGFIVYFALWLAGARRRGWTLVAMLLVVLVASASWELFENTHYVMDRFQRNTVSTEYYGDSILNSLVDTSAMVLGFLLAYQLPLWAVVVIAIILEAITAITIRDGLLLNVVMFTYSVPAIRHWQASLSP